MIQLLPRVATRAEVPELLTLFCAASIAMKLKDSVCSLEKREELRSWFERKCDMSSLWTVDGRNSLVILERDPYGVVEEVRYAIVSENLRRLRIATTIITHIQSLEDVSSLVAEVRNEASKKMLLNCGFAEGDETRSGFPLLRWKKFL
jgi:hypothetical protein